MKSYAAGETTPALIEETIGANFERIAHEFAERRRRLAGLVRQLASEIEKALAHALVLQHLGDQHLDTV